MCCWHKTWAAVAAVATFMFASWIVPARCPERLPGQSTTLECNCAVSAGLHPGSSDTWSCGGLVYVSIVAQSTNTAGVCSKPGCSNPKSCSTNWEFIVQVGDADSQCCQTLGGGVRVTGGNAPSGVILCGHDSPSWNETITAACPLQGSQEGIVEFNIKKADGTTSLFTAKYRTSCNACPP
jgi:hypothetical protein